MKTIVKFSFKNHEGRQGTGTVSVCHEGKYWAESSMLGMGHPHQGPRAAVRDLMHRHGSTLETYDNAEFENDKNPSSPSAAIKNYKAQCAEVKGNGERCGKKRGKRWHFVGRGVEVIALDETGERNDDCGGPEFIETKHLTVKSLRETVANWTRYGPTRNGNTISAIHLCGGFDVYDDFATYMQDMRDGGCGDYEIWDDWAGQDIPLALLQ